MAKAMVSLTHWADTHLLRQVQNFPIDGCEGFTLFRSATYDLSFLWIK